MPGVPEIVVAIIGASVFLTAGIVFTFKPSLIKEYRLRNWIKGVDKLKTWVDLSHTVDSYPGPWFFRFLGIIFIIAALLIILTLLERYFIM
jgi:hypothetical protein